MQVVGWHLGIPASEVYGAATSYAELRVERPGAHVLRVCAGTSCWLNGARQILDSASSQLRVRPGQTTPEGAVTLEETACGFLCGVAPAFELDGKWHGRATPDSLDRIIREIR